MGHLFHDKFRDPYKSYTLNRDNFLMVSNIDLLFSTYHTASFFFGKIHFGVVQLLRVPLQFKLLFLLAGIPNLVYAYRDQ